MGKKSLFVLYVFALLFLLYIVVMYGVIGVENAPMVKAKLKQDTFVLAVWKPFFYLHLLLGIVALLIGPFQFTIGSQKNKALHKALGKVYATAVLINVLAVPYIALFSTGGTGSAIAFLVLDVFWLVTTLMGILRISQKNLVAHRMWMRRSYGITWVFVSFRIVVAILSFAMPTSVSFPIGVYLSIIMNLAFIEWITKRKPTQTVNAGT